MLQLGIKRGDQHLALMDIVERGNDPVATFTSLRVVRIAKDHEALDIVILRIDCDHAPSVPYRRRPSLRDQPQMSIAA